MPIAFQVDGLRGLGERLRGLSAEMATKAARSATNAAAQVVKKQAKRNIETSPSIETRSLLDAVIVKRLGKSQSEHTSEHIVTVRRRKTGRKTKSKQTTAPHAGLVEWGTVNMPAEPYLGPALNTQKERALDAMAEKLKQSIEKAGG